MYHEDLPQLSEEEKEAVRNYAGAHARHAGAAVDLAPDSHRYIQPDQDNPAVAQAVEELVDARRHLLDLSPEGVPGRDGEDYGKLLARLRELDLGSHDALRPYGKALPIYEIPSARQLLYAMLDLDLYLFLTRGDSASGRGRPALFDLPAEVRAQMSEEQIAGAHGDRNELFVRLDRILTFMEDDSVEGRRSHMQGLGYECGQESATFFRCYETEPDYVEGFMHGCIERLEEEGFEEEADNLTQIWDSPDLTSEEKTAVVIEPLLDTCEVREDEGDLWRL